MRLLSAVLQWLLGLLRVQRRGEDTARRIDHGTLKPPQQVGASLGESPKLFPGTVDDEKCRPIEAESAATTVVSPSDHAATKGEEEARCRNETAEGLPSDDRVQEDSEPEERRNEVTVEDCGGSGKTVETSTTEFVSQAEPLPPFLDEGNDTPAEEEGRAASHVRAASSELDASTRHTRPQIEPEHETRVDQASSFADDAGEVGQDVARDLRSRLEVTDETEEVECEIEATDEPRGEECCDGSPPVLTDVDVEQACGAAEEAGHSAVAVGWEANSEVGIDLADGSGNEIENNRAAEEVREEASKQTRKRAARSTPPRPQPESFCEYAVRESELERLPDLYRAWNTIIAKRLLLEGREAESAYLTISPSILRVLAREIREDGDAEASFGSAVGDAYRRRVLAHRGRLRVLRRIGEDGFPECVAFLALSVLAAYHMHSDEEAAGHAYYIRLADLLGVQQSGTYPIGFDPDVFESLWKFTGKWLAERTGRSFALPGEDVGFRRIIAIPLAHVPLRTIDIERLPSFFYASGYEPGSRASLESIDRNLTRWNAQSVLTEAGATAISDDRRPAVLAQIASELECWDGAVREASIRRRSAVVELLLDARPRRPMLFHLPRRPAGFPERFDDGLHVFESSMDGWYDPVPMSREDGNLLSNGYEWEVGDGGIRTVLRRVGKTAIAMTPSDSYSYSGFISSRSLMVGLQCAVVCREDQTGAASQYLGEVSEKEIRSIIHPNLPEGWRLLTNILPTRFREAPEGLDSLIVDSSVSIVPSGGLRIGKRWQWLEGATPRLQVSGLLGGQAVEIDGTPAAVMEGVVEVNGLLSSPGIHVVRVGRVERSIEIVPAAVQRAPARAKVESSRFGVGIPPGNWVLIGKKPGEVHSAGRSPLNAVFTRAPFEPVWAVEGGAKRGARAYCLRPSAGPPAEASVNANEKERRSMEAWVGTIYNANIRRPTLSVCEPTSASSLKGLWNAYAESARGLKRRLRRRTK